MAREIIDIGSNANDGTGDTLRSAMIKVNNNFAELYNETAVDSGITISGNNISANRSNDDINLIPSGTGSVTATNLTIDSNINITDNVITTTQTNSDLVLGASGTGSIVVDSISVKDNTITTNVSDADLELSASGTGTVSINGLKFPTSDGASGEFLRTDGSGNLSFASAGLTLNHSDITDNSATLSTSTQTAIDTFALASYRSVKYYIQITDSTNSRYEILEANVVHDGTTAYVSTSGSVTNYTGSLATFDADISGANVRLLATPISSDSTVFKFHKVSIDL